MKLSNHWLKRQEETPINCDKYYIDSVERPEMIDGQPDIALYLWPCIDVDNIRKQLARLDARYTQEGQ